MQLETQGGEGERSCGGTEQIEINSKLARNDEMNSPSATALLPELPT
jgi:hypothetical protein